MIVDTLVCMLLVLGVAFGISRPFVGLFRLNPPESVVAGSALSLITAWFFAWFVFTTGCPLWAYSLLPVFAAAGIAFGPAGLRNTSGLVRNPEVRDLLVGQLIVTSWCVGWLAFVRSYSGGSWSGDSFEHWERARYFLRDWRSDLFIGAYTLPARPPLANVLTAAFMQMTRADYMHFQLFSTILGSLVYMPVGLLAGRFSGRNASRIAAVILMANPLFVQNATYPWTKLQSSFFILTGLYLYLRFREESPRTTRGATLCALVLGGALVTHYSAGPYIAVIAAAWITGCVRQRLDMGFIRIAALAALAGLAVVSPWFLWSVARFGWHGTFLTNTSVTYLDRWDGNQLLKMALNLRDTLLPPQVRGFQGTLLRQSSRWGMLRDQFFLLYQLNLPFALGSMGCFAVAREACRCAADASKRNVLFWGLALSGFVILSAAVQGDRDHYGITHVCMQSVVLIGLAFLASRWDRLERGWRLALIAGWAFDFIFGIALQFAVEDFAIDRWLTPGRNLGEVAMTYNIVSQINLNAKIMAQIQFFADFLPKSPVPALALLAAIFCAALVRAGKASAIPASE